MLAYMSLDFDLSNFIPLLVLSIYIDKLSTTYLSIKFLSIKYGVSSMSGMSVLWLRL
jgi:hypothetical protein